MNLPELFRVLMPIVFVPSIAIAETSSKEMSDEAKMVIMIVVVLIATVFLKKKFG